MWGIVYLTQGYSRTSIQIGINLTLSLYNHLTAFEAGADNKIIMETTRINYETPHVEVMDLELEQAVLQSSFEPTDGNL